MELRHIGKDLLIIHVLRAAKDRRWRLLLRRGLLGSGLLRRGLCWGLLGWGFLGDWGCRSLDVIQATHDLLGEGTVGFNRVSLTLKRSALFEIGTTLHLARPSYIPRKPP